MSRHADILSRFFECNQNGSHVNPVWYLKWCGFFSFVGISLINENGILGKLQNVSEIIINLPICVLTNLIFWQYRIHSSCDFRYRAIERSQRLTEYWIVTCFDINSQITNGIDSIFMSMMPLSKNLSVQRAVNINSAFWIVACPCATLQMINFVPIFHRFLNSRFHSLLLCSGIKFCSYYFGILQCDECYFSN